MSTEIDDLRYTIKELPETERPREKLIRYGASSLSNDELIGIIIRTGSRKETAIELGKRVLALDSSGLRNLLNITLEELTSLDGIGECKASQILAAVELGKRMSHEDSRAKIRFDSPRTVANVFMDSMRYLQKEHFRVLLLDVKNQIISIEEISIGTLNSAIVHPRDVFNVAIRKNANSLIVVHNHPSGDVSPSREDINVTNRLIEAGEVIGIRVLDHLIVGNDKYLSFKEERLI